MGVLFGPWADLALFLQHSMNMPNSNIESILAAWLFILGLFLSVCLLLLALLVFLNWKLKETQADLLEFPQDRSAIHRQAYAEVRHRRNSTSHSCT